MGVKRVMDPLLRQLRRFGGPIFILLLLIGAFPSGPKQLPPLYADMPAKHWISQLDLPLAARHPRTIEALSAMHQLCLYDLQRRLKSSDSRLRHLMIRAFSFFPSRWRILAPTDPDLPRQAAAEVVVACGPKAAALADSLVVGLRVARSPSAVDALQRALQAVGPSAVRPLSALALASETTTQARALHALSRILTDHDLPAPQRSDLVTIAISQIHSLQPDLALAAHALLAALPDEASHALPAVLSNLEHASPEVRVAAAQFAGRLARQPDLCVNPLVARLQKDPDATARAASAQALGRFGREAAIAVEALSACVADPSASVALAAIQSLGRIGSPAATAAEKLAARSKDSRSGIRAACAVALGRIGNVSPKVLEALSDQLLDEDDYVRLSAARALAAIGPNAVPALDALIRALGDHVESVRVSATDALGAIGPGAARARPHLQAARNNNQSVMSRPVLAALERIESSDTPGVLRSDRQEDKPAR